MADVFVSYNREDLLIAQRIVDSLIKEGLEVWLDMDLRAGENYDEITEERLRGAKAVVVLWSSRSVKSRWVRAEATIGARKSTLVPAMIEECDRPVMFELIQTTDLSGWAGDMTDPHWRAFVEVIRKRIAAAPPGPLFSNSPKKDRQAKGKKNAPKVKQVARAPQQAEKGRGGGMFTVLLVLLLIAILGAGGVYVLRPDLVQPLLAAMPRVASAEPSRAPPAAAAPAPAAAAPAIVGAATPAEVAAVTPVEKAADQRPGTAPPPSDPAGSFHECDQCPVMLNIAGGVFQMGAPDDELGRNAWEGPQRKVAMAPFAISRAEVTFDQWDACAADGGCDKYKPDDHGTGRGDRPVVQVSWRDAAAYTEWLSRKTKRVYRLPTEAEWEYAARAGTTTPFWWGPLFDASKAGAGTGTQSVGQLPANAFGLIGVTGNAREWVQDCYVNTFAKAPLDGRSVEVSKCAVRVIRGGAFNDAPQALRIAGRGRNDPAYRDRLTGFRVAAAP